MSDNMQYAEIIAIGLVQGVGFRYFVTRHAARLGVTGFTKNLYSGEVLTCVEGERFLIEELFSLLKVGPSHAHVTKCFIEWGEYKGRFTGFEVRG